MTYLDFVKKTGLLKLVILLMDELGYPNKEITEKLQITEPTIYNTRRDFERLTNALESSGAAEVEILGELIPKDPERNGTITEVVKKDARNPEVQKVVDAFQGAFGTTKVSKWDRFAASRLSKKYGADNIAQIITILAQHQGDKYTPVVNSIRQLEEKWVNVSNFFSRIQENQEVEL